MIGLMFFGAAIHGDGLTQTGYLNSTDAASHGNDFIDGGVDDDWTASQRYVRRFSFGVHA